MGEDFHRALSGALKGAVFIVAVVFLGFLAYMAWTNIQSQGQLPLVLNPNQAAPTSSVLNWQTYTNKDYGLEFQYPGDYELALDTGNPSDIQDSEFLPVSSGFLRLIGIRPKNWPQAQYENGEEIYYTYYHYPVTVIVERLDKSRDNKLAELGYVKQGGAWAVNRGASGTGNGTDISFSGSSTALTTSWTGVRATTPVRHYAETGSYIGVGSRLEALIFKDNFYVAVYMDPILSEQVFDRVLSSLKFNATAELSASSTAGWKTYRNEKYGFEVKRPSNFDGPEKTKFSMYPFYLENIDGEGFFHRVHVRYCGESGLEEHCTDNPVNMSLEFFILEKSFNFVRKNFEEIDVSETFGEVFIDGIKGIHAMAGVEGTGQFYAVFPLENGNKTLVIQRGYTSEGSIGVFQGVKDFISFDDQKKTFDQILSTFKFIPSMDSGQSRPISTSGWKTYSNDVYRFSFVYPPDWTVTWNASDFSVSAMPTSEIGKQTSRVLLKVNPILNHDTPFAFPYYFTDGIFAGKNAKFYECPTAQNPCSGMAREKDIKILNHSYSWSDNNVIEYYVSSDVQNSDAYVKVMERILSTFKFL